MLVVNTYPEFAIDFQIDYQPLGKAGSSMYRFNTKPDVTPYEATRLCELITGCCSGAACPSNATLVAFLDTHNLRRHFDKITIQP